MIFPPFRLLALGLTLSLSASAFGGTALSGGEGGRLRLADEAAETCLLAPMIADRSWNMRAGKALPSKGDGGFPFECEADGKRLSGSLAVSGRDGTVHAVWSFAATEEIAFQTLAVATTFPLPSLAGGAWKTDSSGGTFPAAFGAAHLFGGMTRSLTLTFPDKRVVSFSFAQPVAVTLQDDRQWGSPEFTLRIGRFGGKMAPGERFEVAADVTASGGLAYSAEPPPFLRPVTLAAGDEWVPLRDENEIVAGSALDLSLLGLTPGPCGTKGRVIATPEGHFAFADEPGTPRRFYGVNFCFTALYLQKEQVDRLLDRLVRLGYNAIRVHHYEGGLMKKGETGFDWDPAKVDQLDYFMAGCAKRGLWMTTDLYVSRPVAGSQVGRSEPRLEQDQFKLLVPVSDAAFKDWATFSRKFLDRVNPYTGKRIADDPALAWISLVNEGPVTNYWTVARAMPEWQAAWNRWLARRYPDRAALAKALGDLAPGEDPAAGAGVALPPGLGDMSPRARLAQVFAAETERDAYERMRHVVRDEIGCPALLTNMNNAGPTYLPLQAARREYDYVDEHFYIDHPRFLEKPWALPSAIPNANPILSGADGGSSSATVRLWGKPFTITEFNYAGPGRFRGVGGVLTGAFGAVQDWDALWRFAYSHSDQSLFQPARATYFDLAGDALMQAGDRLAVLLYLRGDVKPAPARLALGLAPETLASLPDRASVSGMRAAAWLARIGTAVSEGGTVPPGAVALTPDAAGNRNAVLAALGKDPGSPIRSETGEIEIRPAEGVLAVDTPRSAGGYAEPGKAILCPNAGVAVDGLTIGATVFVSSLDADSGAPIRSSRRLLVTHLTDLQNAGIRYGEAARKTLLDWGGLPHLVRDGSAVVRIAVDQPGEWTVWALSPGGNRVEKVEARTEDGKLVFTASVRGKEGARMLYEVTR